MLDNLVFVLFWGIIFFPFVSALRSYIKGEDMDKSLLWRRRMEWESGGEMTQSWFDMSEFKLRYVLPPLLLLALGLVLGSAWGGYRVFG